MELNGKIIDFLGDSITEGTLVVDKSNRYDNFMLSNCKLSAVHNYGIGGTRIAHQNKPSAYMRHDLSFCARAYDLDKSANVVIVFGGTNDYGHGDAPFGELCDSTPATFCGAVDFLIRTLKEQHPNAKIVFMAPCRRLGDDSRIYNDMKIEDAKPLKAYVDVIIEKCKAYDIPVLNLYDELGIDPNNEEDKIKYAPDGLHLNDAGHIKLAGLLTDFLRGI